LEQWEFTQYSSPLLIVERQHIAADSAKARSITQHGTAIEAHIILELQVLQAVWRHPSSA